MKDDGAGLGQATPTTEGMGLRIMQYRAGIIQGTLSVGNDKGGGVIVSCTAPVSGLR